MDKSASSNKFLCPLKSLFVRQKIYLKIIRKHWNGWHTLKCMAFLHRLFQTWFMIKNTSNKMADKLLFQQFSITERNVTFNETFFM